MGKSIALINAAHSGDGAGPPAITAVAAASERTAPAPIEFKKVIKGRGSRYVNFLYPPLHPDLQDESQSLF